ncbi:uncharacterized protein LOC135837230 [Planococcus citri]|uniref:uncharacterized protein LOC135837230 n=1 Tax=Planococcus citri TaxID=170843 RepID=UPI0031FA25D1
MYVYVHLFNLHIYLTVLLTSSASNPEKGEIVDHNPDQDFRCDDGHYIARIFVCDGIPDCDDNSDETRDQCRNISCNDQTFQCGYGACISKEYLCDGLKQCIDGSDETPQACNTTLIRKSNRSKRAAGDSCPEPPPSLDKVITYNCDETPLKSCGVRNGYNVPKLTVATIKCKPNYYPEKEPSPSFCYNNNWQPPFENCFKKCEKLNPVNIDMKCYRKGVNIPCDENALLAGSKIRPVCKELHKYGDFVPDYREITCKENGKWDKTLFSCIPECGRPYTNPKKLIKGGVEESISDSPWHVAIYNAKKVLICGGTIISPYIVLSAAHCFEEDNKPTTNTTNYEVVASKVSRNYSIRDNRNQKVFKIKEIQFAGKGYFGNTNYNTADIVALILKEKLDISATVLPACIDWTGSGRITYPEEDTLGKVSGWGRIEHEGKYSENLTTVNLPFISRQRCYDIVPDDFKPFITLDKFCAGKEGGAGVLQGDSGGGFLLRDGPFYYLRGIVSVKRSSETSIAAFTDLTDHIDWILRMRDEVNNNIMSPSKKNSLETLGKRICEDYDVNNCMKIEDCLMADHLIITRRAIFCGHDADGTEKICCSLPNSTQSFSSSERQGFAKGIYHHVLDHDHAFSESNPNENFIVDPLNMVKILAAITLGSARKTETELVNSFHNNILTFKNQIYRAEESHQQLANLAHEVNTHMTDEVALFLQKEYSIQPTFINQVKRLYNANVIKLDYRNGGKESEIAVNKWVSDHSANQIKEMTHLPINQSTIFLAIGVSYLNNGDWEYPFLETRQQLFFTKGKNGENVDIRVEMMFGRAPIPYYEDKEIGYRAIILPYKNKSMHMCVMLPTQNVTLKNLRRWLQHYDFTGFIAKAEESRISEVSYAIPKMHLEMSYNMKPGLQYWYMEPMFDPVRADFSKITDKQIHVSEILQRVVIDVNEKAGDATTNVGTTISHINNDKYINFTCDRPFIFFIYDDKTKVITFWGTVLRPTPYT